MNTPRAAAEFVKAHGRFGDTELVHMNKAELGILKDIWPHSINPQTGQPEFFLQFLLPFLGLTGIEAALAGAALGAAGSSIMGGDPLTGALTGGLGPALGLMGGAADIAGHSLGGDLAASGAAEAGGKAAGGLFGGSGSGLMALGLLPMLMGDMSGNKGPKGPAPYDPSKYPEQFPSQPRQAVPAPAGYQPGVSPEHTYVYGQRYGQGYAHGGSVNPFDTPAGRAVFDHPLFGPLYEGKLGGRPGHGNTPMPRPTRPVPIPRDLEQVIAGSSLPAPVTPTAPISLYTPPTYTPPLPTPQGGQNLFAALMAARPPGGLAPPPGYARGGIVEEAPDKYAPGPMGNNGLFQFGLINLLPQLMDRVTNNTTPEYQSWMMNQKKKRPLGYTEGGQVTGQPNDQDAQLVKATILALTGQAPNPEKIIQAFVARFGEEALADLVQRLKSQQSGGQGRMVNGPGDGLSDGIAASVDGQQPAALSSGEFVIPADAVSHLGNGSNEAGASQLQQMIDRARQSRTGTSQQAPALDPTKVMPV